MTIIQLEYLLAVANHGSFSLASEKCFVTQPSLSMQIKSLEEELGVILFDRSKKPVLPTEAGKAVIARAKDAIAAFQNVREVINEMRGEITGLIRLGVIPTIGPYLIHKFLPEFSRKYPKVELRIREMITSDIIDSLNRDVLDAAIMAGGTASDNIIEEEIFNDRFWAYVSPSHAFYQRRNIRIEDIDVRNLLLLSEGNCMRDQVIELCQAQQSIPRQYNFECGSLETLIRIVDNTSFMTILPEMSLDYLAEYRQDQIKSLAKGASSRKITIATRRTYIKRALVNALKETIAASRNK